MHVRDHTEMDDQRCQQMGGMLSVEKGAGGQLIPARDHTADECVRV